MASTRGFLLLSGVADFYFLALGIGVVAALDVAVTGRPIPTAAAFAIPLLALVGAVAYHVRVAKRTPWLSPGEQMHGRRVADGAKHWTNPWERNRWALFAANFVALVLLGNTWDGLAEGTLVTMPQVVVKTLYVVLVALGLIALGRGLTLGVLGPVLLYVVHLVAFRQVARQAIDPEPLAALTLVPAGLGLLHVLIVGIYAYLRRRSRLHHPDEPVPTATPA